MYKPDQLHVGEVTDESTAGTFSSRRTPMEKARNLISRRMQRVERMCQDYVCGMFRACLKCRSCYVLARRIAQYLQPT
jgi:hypothetical protein